MEVVASLSQGRTAAAQCGLFTHKSAPVIFEPLCTLDSINSDTCQNILVILCVYQWQDLKFILCKQTRNFEKAMMPKK